MGGSDLFSVGAVLYEMCAGHAPFGGKTSAVIFQKILDKEPEPLRGVNPSLPLRLEEIVAKALEKDRDLRCQTAAELRADLKRLQRDTTSGRGHPARTPWRCHRYLSSQQELSAAHLLPTMLSRAISRARRKDKRPACRWSSRSPCQSWFRP